MIDQKNDLPWMTEARKHLGLSEIPGPKNEPQITAWLRKLRAWWDDDETPWCGVFVAACIGYGFPKNWMRAREWATWGIGLNGPRYGCIVVFARDGGGHVGFLAGMDGNGRLMILGGNQGNRVSIAPFDPGRVIAYRWPASWPAALQNMPIVASTDKSSANES